MLETAYDNLMLAAYVRTCVSFINMSQSHTLVPNTHTTAFTLGYNEASSFQVW